MVSESTHTLSTIGFSGDSAKFGILMCTCDFLTTHSASFPHNLFSGMLSFLFSESQDAMVLQTFQEK